MQCIVCHRILFLSLLIKHIVDGVVDDSFLAVAYSAL